jgi:FkbM family methyltransferase
MERQESRTNLGNTVIELAHKTTDSMPESAKSLAKHFLKNRLANVVVRFIAKKLLGRSREGAIQYLLMRIPVVGRFRVVLPDRRSLIINGDGSYGDPIAKALYWWGFQGHEPETAGIFYELAKKSNTIFDVGANIGYFSLLCNEANKTSKVFSFEPSPNHFDRLRTNILLNYASNVTPVRTCVGAEDGEVVLYLTEAGSTSSIVRGFRKPSAQLVAPCLALDSFVTLNQIDRVDLIKIDVEGAEPLVFEGMRHVLDRDEPDIICEVLRSSESFLNEFLEKYGYNCYHITEAGLVKRTMVLHDEEHRHLNYLFSKRQL